MTFNSKMQMRGLAALAKLAESSDTTSTETKDPSATAKATPAPDPMEGQRKQDLHLQQMQFNTDKHELDLEKLKQGLQQSQESFQVKQEQDQIKMQQQQESQQQEQQEQQTQQAMQAEMMQQQQAQQGQQYQQNIMAKAAAMYTDALEPVSMSSAGPALAIGAGLGGTAAHVIAPSTASQHYRDLASEITPDQVKASLAGVKKHGKNLRKKMPELWESVTDTSMKGDKVKFSAPPHLRKRFFQNRALQANAKRLAAGSGLGLLAGLASYSAMRD